MDKKNRIHYVDAAKAIAIILVIIGHCYWNSAIPRLSNLIYSFHMPLFFIVSGFFLKNLEVKNAIEKYAKAYLWPYLIIGILMILLGFFKSMIQQESLHNIICEIIVRIMWGSNCESQIIFGNIPYIGPSWFLLALFWGCIAITVLNKIKDRVAQICLLALAASFSVCSSKIIKMPLSLQGGAICVTYLYIGNYIVREQLINRIYGLPKWIKLMALVLWLMVAVFISGIYIGSGVLGYSIVGFIVSLIGTFFVLGMCKHFKLHFSWVGRNTLYILCGHILLWRILDAFGYSSKNLPFNPQLNFMLEASYEIAGALLLGWLLSKTGLLDYKRIIICKQNTII